MSLVFCVSPGVHTVNCSVSIVFNMHVCVVTIKRKRCATLINTTGALSVLSAVTVTNQMYFKEFESVKSEDVI